MTVNVNSLKTVQAAVTKYLRLDLINKRNLFVTVPEAEESKIKVPADSGVSYKGTNPIHEGTTLTT